MKLKQIGILKRGSQYTSVTAGSLSFKDLMLFTCPMSLDKYLKTWGTEAEKMVYPYTLFESIEEIRHCTDFPAIEHFSSDKEINPEVYEKCKQMFESRMNLEDDNPYKWRSFEDYLKFYNLSDCAPTARALINQFKIFEEAFGLCPFQCLGLPQFARKAMYRMYRNDAPAVFSFSPTDQSTSSATKIFRQNTIGGLVMVYKRHVTLDPNEDAPSAAKFNRDGMFSYFS